MVYWKYAKTLYLSPSKVSLFTCKEDMEVHVCMHKVYNYVHNNHRNGYNGPMYTSMPVSAEEYTM